MTDYINDITEYAKKLLRHEFNDDEFNALIKKHNIDTNEKWNHFNRDLFMEMMKLKG